MILVMAWTTEVYLKKRKTCTRRRWADKTLALWQRAWDEGRLFHAVYDRNPRNGGRQVGTLKLTCRPYRERLGDMPESDVKAEGGLWVSKQEFIELFGDADIQVTVVRFKPLPFKVIGGSDG